MTGTTAVSTELENQEAGRIQAAHEAYSALVIRAVDGSLSADDADKLRSVLDVLDLPMKSTQGNESSFEKDVTTLRNVAGCKACIANILARHGVKDHKELEPRMAEAVKSLKAAEEALRENRKRQADLANDHRTLCVNSAHLRILRGRFPAFFDAEETEEPAKKRRRGRKAA